jgi:ATP-binding cassette subfamily B protein
MDRGEVAEVGSHDELIARQGAYWRLYQAQARRVDADADEANDIERARISAAVPVPSAHVMAAP